MRPTSCAGSIEYASARLAARFGARPDDRAWQRIEPVREFAALVEAARGTVLQPWLQGIAAHSSAHEIEAQLRARWQAQVVEVAGWMPERWQRAILWCAVLPYLPILLHLARREAPLPWMRGDARLADLCVGGYDTARAALAAGPWGPLASAWPTPDALPGAWRAEWQRRMPQHPAGDPRLLAALARTLTAHLAGSSGAPGREGRVSRRALQARLAVLFRRALLDPAAAFVFLALVALDLERLRGELLRRVAFPGLPLAGTSGAAGRVDPASAARGGRPKSPPHATAVGEPGQRQ
jgi:hypothetical protein